jgi:hypothetical protein
VLPLRPNTAPRESFQDVSSTNGSQKLNRSIPNE